MNFAFKLFFLCFFLCFLWFCCHLLFTLRSVPRREKVRKYKLDQNGTLSRSPSVSSSSSSPPPPLSPPLTNRKLGNFVTLVALLCFAQALLRSWPLAQATAKHKHFCDVPCVSVLSVTFCDKVNDPTLITHVNRNAGSPDHWICSLQNQRW